MAKQRLISQNIQHAGLEELSDALLIFAQNIETAFLLAGALPGEDYSRKDLMEMAVTFAAQNGEYAVDVTVYK